MVALSVGLSLGMTAAYVRYAMPQPIAQSQAQHMVADGGTSGTTDAVAQTETVADTAEHLTASVVGISTIERDAASMFHLRGTQTQSVGSGVVVSDGGYILTNHHVVSGRPEQVMVTLSDGRVTEGKTEWSDSNLDIAIVKVAVGDLVPATLGDATKMHIGDPVIAIGNPLSMQFQRTVTFGIVSALNRNISVPADGEENYMTGLLQTDASINPGNSGGPLVNRNGEVIGINTVKLTSAEGMGFAVPINICKPVVEAFLKEGTYRAPYLGIGGYDRAVSDFVMQGEGRAQGMYVAALDVKGPAFRAGVRVGDTITAIDGNSVADAISLTERFFAKKPGDRIHLTMMRSGQQHEVTVTATERNRIAKGI